MAIKRKRTTGSKADLAAKRLRNTLGSRSPALAIVLGSGFQAVADVLENSVAVAYSKLPGFPKSRVSGHAGSLLHGTLGGTPLVLMCGRSHYYEGHSMAEITLPVRALATWGIADILLTNAAGGINPKYRPGEFMSLSDHINLMGASPLRPLKPGGKPPEFLDLSAVYDSELSGMLRRAARTSKARLHSGVYVAVSGPTYETPAEIRAYRKLGGDAVGMSTVPEAIVARDVGLKVVGLSLITNLASGIGEQPLSHDEVLQTGGESRQRAAGLLTSFCKNHGNSQT